jgi:hypothetical protein
VLSNDELVFTADALKAFLAGRSGRTTVAGDAVASNAVQEAAR